MNKILPILLIFAATAAPAFAYIDPNAGGLIAQVLTPLLLVMGWRGPHFAARSPA